MCYLLKNIKYYFEVYKYCVYLQSNFAVVVELVDTLDLGSSAARRGGSTPFSRTKKGFSS